MQFLIFLYVICGWLAGSLLMQPVMAQQSIGTWSHSGLAPNISRKGVSVHSAIIAAPSRIKEGMRIRSVRWEYRFLTPLPNTLQVSLCNQVRCITLDGVSGKTEKFSGDNAATNFHFRYQLTGHGYARPILHGLSNQVIVGYGN